MCIQIFRHATRSLLLLNKRHKTEMYTPKLKFTYTYIHMHPQTYLYVLVANTTSNKFSFNTPNPRPCPTVQDKTEIYTPDLKSTYKYTYICLY